MVIVWEQRKIKFFFFFIIIIMFFAKEKWGESELLCSVSCGPWPQLDKVGQPKKWLQELKLKANVKSYFYV